MDVKYKVGIGLLSVMISLICAVLFVLPSHSAYAPSQYSLLRARRSDLDDDKLKFETPVLRHHAVHTEVNSHIGFENFLKAAAAKPEESVDIDDSSDDEPLSPGVPDSTEPEHASETREIEINYENNIVEMNAMMRSPSLEITLPNFDICPIGPELPGESGSIRKVRDTERAKVDRRISEKLGKFRNNTAHGCTSDCHVGCPEGTYRLPGMAQCRPRLNCSQIKRLLPTKDRYLIGGGGVKRIYTANLQGNAVVIARVKRFKFNQYLDSMVELQQTGIVAQLVGMCEEPAWPEVVLQYHSLGSLLSVAQMPSDLDLRWRVVMSYLDVVEKLHNEVPRSPRVLCDASRTEITLSQFLLTDDFRVVLNDVDELIAASTDGKVRCNCNIIRGGSEFSDGGEGMGCLVPPEQKKCGTNVFYTEKIDIWKIPDITAAILGESDDSVNLWNHLYHIHQECKLDDPTLRPPIEFVVAKYREVQDRFQIQTGL